MSDGLAAALPVPDVDALSAEFWAGCRRRELLVPRCGACNRHAFPPPVLCPCCRSTARAWTPSRGVASVFTFTIAHHAVHPSLQDHVPYNIAVVQLDDCDGVLMTTNIVDCGPDQLAIGLPVEVTWTRQGEDVVVPRFRPRRAE